MNKQINIKALILAPIAINAGIGAMFGSLVAPPLHKEEEAVLPDYSVNATPIAIIVLLSVSLCVHV